jgi:transcriptional regulator GlxA family with amidase domain
LPSRRERRVIVDPRIFGYEDQLGRVKDYVEHRVSDSIHLADVAREAGMAPKSFSAYFKRKTSVCFSDWLISYRVGVAKRLLLERNVAVWQVAQRVGMDERTFRRVFRKQTGLSGREYRRKYGLRPALPWPLLHVGAHDWGGERSGFVPRSEFSDDDYSDVAVSIGPIEISPKRRDI